MIKSDNKIRRSKAISIGLSIPMVAESELDNITLEGFGEMSINTVKMSSTTSHPTVTCHCIVLKISYCHLKFLKVQLCL
ncbi:MAG: hypothetical protein LBI98_00225 [Endomicrobium sp.]|jgi:hypothetical protein|nr:hypothetical protein [Endomicrobium sp.]